MILRNILLFSAAVIAVASYPLFEQGSWFETAKSPAKTPPVTAKVETPQRTELGRTVRIRADERGHYSADFTINGRRVEAMIDTGASVVAINRSTAKRLGISVAADAFSHTVNTANGDIKAAFIRLPKVEIGRIQVRDVPAVVLDDNSLSGTLVGMSFLKSLRFSVDNNVLVLKQ